jgi:hypothetical protein
MRTLLAGLLFLLTSVGTAASSSTAVKGYYRRDGTYVHSYARSSGQRSRYRPTGVRVSRRAVGVPRDQNGRIKRSPVARSAFMRQHPCPATGRRSGACRGYVVDHIDPLECGGADAPSNMQWQTVSEAKLKDRTEGNCRRR